MMKSRFIPKRIACEISADNNIANLTLTHNNRNFRLNRTTIPNRYTIIFQYVKGSTIKVSGRNQSGSGRVKLLLKFVYNGVVITEISTVAVGNEAGDFSIKVSLSGSRRNQLKQVRNRLKATDKVVYSTLANSSIEEYSNFTGVKNNAQRYTESKRSAEEKKEKGKQVEVFYGTNRNKTGNSNFNDFYGSEICTLKVGKCKINIPDNHKTGKIERPMKILWLWELKENDDKHITLKDIQEFDLDVFYKHILEDCQKTENKSGLLFIHGYNTSFAEAAWRTGQIAYDMPFNGITGFFSWPSAGKLRAYPSDLDKAEGSEKALAQFINHLITKGGVKKLHIIAHSMGSRVTTKALIELSKEPDFKDYIASIQQVILAAPDLDPTVFKETIFPDLKYVGASRTLYVCKRDRALKTSKFLRRRSRLGQGGESIFVSEELYSIDASDVLSPGNHYSYVFETDQLLNDLYHLLRGLTDPEERRLRSAVLGKLKYWFFPK